MQSINDLLKLFMRQAALERAPKQPSAARVIAQRSPERALDRPCAGDAATAKKRTPSPLAEPS
jgi:hypothetical protein